MNQFIQCLSKDLYYINIISEDESEILTSRWVTSEELKELDNTGIKYFY